MLSQPRGTVNQNPRHCALRRRFECENILIQGFSQLRGNSNTELKNAEVKGEELTSAHLITIGTLTFSTGERRTRPTWSTTTLQCKNCTMRKRTRKVEERSWDRRIWKKSLESIMDDLPWAGTEQVLTSLRKLSQTRDESLPLHTECRIQMKTWTAHKDSESDPLHEPNPLQLHGSSLEKPSQFYVLTSFFFQALYKAHKSNGLLHSVKICSLFFSLRACAWKGVQTPRTLRNTIHGPK